MNIQRFYCKCQKGDSGEENVLTLIDAKVPEEVQEIFNQLKYSLSDVSPDSHACRLKVQRAHSVIWMSSLAQNDLDI